MFILFDFIAVLSVFPEGVSVFIVDGNFLVGCGLAGLFLSLLVLLINGDDLLVGIFLFFCFEFLGSHLSFICSRLSNLLIGSQLGSDCLCHF